MNNFSAIGKSLVGIAGLLLVFTAGHPVLASDPVAIYALIDKVVFEPDSQTPDRIQIWGVFALSKGEFGNSYESPARGYLYLSLPEEKQEIAKAEWADLKKVAGTGQCVAFGSRYQVKKDRLKLRNKQDRPESPDRYPVAFGLTKLRDDHYQVRPLKDLAASRP